MKHHRGDAHGAAEEKKARARGGKAHHQMLATGGAHRHERKRGGMISGESKIKSAEEMDDEGRKKGGAVHGKKPKARADKMPRGEHEAKRARGGAMTPKSPLTGAGNGKPPVSTHTMPLDEGGRGEYGNQDRKRGGRMKKRAMGGAMPQTAEEMPKGTQFKRGGHAPKRARGGGMMGKKDGADCAPAGRSHGGRLTSGERQRLPSSDFALPGKGTGKGGKGAGSYPIDTVARARNALARGAQHASPAELATIKKKVHARYPAIHET